MNRLYKKTTSSLLILAILLTTAAAATLGDELHMAGTELAEGTQLAKGVHWSTAYSDMLAENFIEYKPSTAVKPKVVYGSKVQNYGNFQTMSNLMESRGYHVIGGINGDFFDTHNYNPLGIVITDGIIRSSDEGFCAIGFKEDGSAFMGWPSLDIKLNIHTEEYRIATINKPRQDGAYNLFTEDYATTTKNSKPGRDVILTPKDGASLRVGTALTLTVDEIIKSTGAIDIPDGKMVLSLSSLADDWRQYGIDSLSPGDEITVTVTSPEEGWDAAQQAIGSFRKIVTNGSVLTDLDTSRHPRTAVGIKADGTVLLYTIDGRQPGLSVGATMPQVAARLVELGCVNAGIMDGGGSTTINALYIGNESISQINSPSDGAQRSVTNYLMLVTETPATGVAARLGVHPYDVLMLKGATQQFEIKAADSGAYPAPIPEGLSISLSNGLGEIVDKTSFYAAAPGKETIAVSAGEASGFATATVIETPDSISISSETSGKGISSLNVTTGDSVDLTANAKFNRLSLVSHDTCFVWSADEAIGSIDSMGVFTAGTGDASGNIYITAGEKTVSIPVTVGWNSPFADVKKSDWYYDSVKYSYLSGIFNGVSDTSFSPNTGMSRGMFVTAFGRMLDIDTAQYTGPAGFTDVKAGAYYAPYVDWASENGIVTGFEDSTFRPDELITREQLCTLIARYTNSAGITLPEVNASPAFKDAGQIAEYAREYVDACQTAGLVNGKDNGSFAPRDTATRAESSAILQRTAAYIVK